MIQLRAILLMAAATYAGSAVLLHLAAYLAVMTWPALAPAGAQ